MKLHSAAVVLVAPFLRSPGAEAEATGRRGLGLAPSSDHVPNAVVAYSNLAIKWVELSERGPTVSGHFVVHVLASLYDAWAAFEDGTTGAITDLDGGGVRVSDSNVHAREQIVAMVDAAYEVITTMGQTLLDQKYLEIENGENATARAAELMDEALATRDALIDAAGGLGQSPVATSVAGAVSYAILTSIRADGSNYQNDYADTSGYAIRPMFEPVPVITDPRTDYNFLDGSWVTRFNTYDAVAADAVPNPGYAQVHPLVRNGTLTLTETYQSLTQHGIFPPDADGGEQFPLTAHWGDVRTFSLEDASSLRTEVFGPYDEEGELNELWVEEAREIVDLAYLQQDGNCPACRAESEYWELGDEFPYPPGWWIQRATDIAEERGLDVKESLQLIFGVSITVFDAGVAAWGMKYAEDTVRPVTTINELFKGSEVSDWRGNRLANIDDKNHWRPYQLRRNIVPPFPDIPSGHSAFSTSASAVLRHLLGSNVFDFHTEPFASRFDLTDGFDGDFTNGNEDIVLEWDTFSQAADAAGFSRLLGGIHMMQGNVVGLEMGARVGHATIKYLRRLFGEEGLGRDPVGDVFADIVFGTGQDDALLIAPCVPGSPSEVYGFYGDDVLEFNIFDDCGPVNLFGGYGADTFRIGAAGATIQDYETQDTIELLREEGPVSVFFENDVTTVLVDGDAVVDLDGVWSTNQLNIVFTGPPPPSPPMSKSSKSSSSSSSKD